MCKESLVELFCLKITGELEAFKRRELEKDKSTIIADSYEIDVMINLYELLCEECQEFEDNVLQEIMHIPNFLAFLYGKWMSVEDSYCSELRYHIEMINQELMKKKEIA